MGSPKEQELEAENARLREELRAVSGARGSARLWRILDRSLNEIYIFHPETLRFEYANAGALKNLGFTLDQMHAMTPVDIKPEHTEETFRAMVRPLLDNQVDKVVFQTLHSRADQTTYPVEVHLQLVPHEDTRVFVAIINDITERQRAERALRDSEAGLMEAQKLESVGRLAGGVAHDFNNMLTAIMSYTEILERAPVDEPVNREDLREIRAAAERARDLTAQLLAFARRQVISPKTLSLNRVVSNAMRFLQRVLGEDVELSTHLAPQLWPVRVDPSQLEQVILNLAVNARDAMPEGGKLTLETENVVLDADYVTQHPGMAAGEHVLLVVSDTGVGMPSDVQARAFEPFFTTKPAGKGTGLGLSMVYGIVRQSGGHIWLYSEVGVGTTFKLYFPRSPEAELPLDAAERPAVRPNGGNERILVVEDDEIVQGVVVRALREAGYEVLFASRPEQALELARKARFELLLTDVVMPGMSGKELAARLLQIRPALRVLYVSGYTENTIVHHGVLEEGINFLAKPFTPSTLRERVRQVLDQHR